MTNNKIYKKKLAAARMQLRKDSAQWPEVMSEVAEEGWPKRVEGGKPLRLWRSRRFAAMLYKEGRHYRLSVCRAELDDDFRWKDGITWEELQQIKSECGFHDEWAVEVFPPDREVVNVANMRHLWMLRTDGGDEGEQPEYGWKR